MNEDKIFHIICDEREKFNREGPAKTTNDLWQRKAARRIMALVNEMRPNQQAVIPTDSYSPTPTIR